jgi:hypothetical protein
VFKVPFRGFRGKKLRTYTELVEKAGMFTNEESLDIT